MERVRRRWWTAFVTAGALVLILGALLTASFQLVMQVAPGYRQDLSDYVSHVAGQPIDIGGVGLGWSGLAPRLDLSDITLFGEDQRTPALSARKLSVGFSLLRLVRGDTTPRFIELTGLELFARVDRNGKLSLRGLDTSGMPSRATQDWLRQLGRFDSVRLRQCELQLEDERLSQPLPDFQLVSAELSFDQRAGHGSASAEIALPPSMGQSLIIDADILGNHERPESWYGRWSVELLNLRNLPWIDAALIDGGALHFGDTHLELEGVLEGGAFGDMTVTLDAGRVEGSRDDHVAALDDLRFIASLLPQRNGWILEVTELAVSGAHGPWPETRARVQYWNPVEGPPRLDAQTDYFLLADLAPWLPLLPGEAFADARERLGGLHGAVRGLSLEWSGREEEDARAQFRLHAEIENMGLSPSAEGAGIGGISGTFSATQDGGSLVLRDTSLAIVHPQWFAQPVQFESVAGELSWTQAADHIHLDAPELQWQLAGASGSVRLGLDLPSGKSEPRLHLVSDFSADDATRLKSYMPLKWSKSLRDWLQHAIVTGRADRARLEIEGPLDGIPYRDGQGRFDLDIHARDAELAFAPRWPSARDVDARLRFRNDSLEIKATAGTLGGNRIEAATARIASFREQQLVVSGEVQGDAARFYDFLQASPLASRLSALLDRTRASGDAVASVALDIPLRDIESMDVDGSVRLRGVKLDVRGLDEPVTELRGDVHFDRRDAHAPALQGVLFGTRVQGAVRREADGELWLRGNFTHNTSAEDRSLARILPSLLDGQLAGSSRWQASLPLSGDDAGRLELESDLQGLAVALPEPMRKPAEASWPLRVRVDTGSTQSMRLQLDMPERLGADLRLARSADQRLELRRGRIFIGPGQVPSTEEDNLTISGTTADFAPLEWVRAVRPARGLAAGEPVNSFELPLYVDLNVGRLWIGGQTVEGVRVALSPAAAGWTSQLSGTGAQGRLAYRADGNGGAIQGDFDVLRLTHHREEPNDADAEREPAPASPAQLPTVALDVRKLHIGEAALGHLEFASQRVPGGQRIAYLRTQGGGTSLDVRGQWLRQNARSSGDLQFSLESSAVDDLLEGLGYAPTLSAKRSRLRGQLQWLPTNEGAEKGLVWTRGEGTIELDLKDGSLRTVKPGAGRVLGLINFYALPRRLALDFSDVVSEGLGFDDIDGSFAIADGVAHTNDLDIDGPSLKMKVRGDVGLVARTYDQRIAVYPDVSSGVTLGALLLGGPAAAALALIAQEVLDQPLDQVGQLSYRLTGSWDDPHVVREGSRERRAAAEAELEAAVPTAIPPEPAP